MLRLTLTLALSLTLLACSDDTTPSLDSRRPDAALDIPLRTDVPPQSDAKPAPDGKPALDGKPAQDGKPALDAKPVLDTKPALEASPIPEAGGTPCGGGVCSALQVCVGKTPVGPTTAWSCEPVIKGCEGSSLRNCACLGKALCVGAFDTCIDSKLPNTILCECPNCQ